MQAKIRGALVRNRLWRKKRELAALFIEAGFRTLLARKQLKSMHHAAEVLQNFQRRNRCRTEFLKTKARAIKLQRWWRSYLKRRRWRNFQKNVLLIQRVCKGAIGRKRATERLVQKRCLIRVVRKLVRIRQKNIEYRAWRKKTMQWYTQKKTNQPPFDHDALATGTLKLWQKDQAQELEIAQLREANRRLEEQCDSLGYYAWLRIRRCFNSEPLPIPRT
jgi:myosin heavy subunit